MKLKVSIVTITYNHERYIAQAIESVMKQETEFDYELVIGEDCSGDNTRAIVESYHQRYPDMINLLPAKPNMGGYNNFVQTLRACRGDYIAILDGDDYWTDPHKLQKQVDFLDSHPDCTLCFHNVEEVYTDEDRPPRIFYRAGLSEILTIEDLLDKTYILPVSAMFRNGLVADELPQPFRKLPLGDWPRFVLLAQQGQIGYINEVMGAYRQHAGGGFCLKKGNLDDLIRLRLAQLESYRVVNEYLDCRYDKIMRRRMADICYDLAKAYKQRKNWAYARKYVTKGWRAKPSLRGLAIKLFLVSCFPQIYMHRSLRQNLRSGFSGLKRFKRGVTRPATRLEQIRQEEEKIESKVKIS